MLRFTWLRRAPEEPDQPYLMPRSKAESDRLDLQHHLLKLIVGKNYVAPLRGPLAILDVACGTGLWSREIAQEFQTARVVGFDLALAPLERALRALGPTGQFPQNFRFLAADALKPFPFEDEAFDFTHARFLAPFVPTERWPQVVAEMLRVTRPGGHLELVEVEALPASQSLAFTALTQALEQLCGSRNLDTRAGSKLTDYLRQAGAARVQQQRLVAGIGRSVERQQRLLTADLFAIFKHLEPTLIKAGYFTQERYGALIKEATQEVPRLGITAPLILAVGQRL